MRTRIPLLFVLCLVIVPLIAACSQEEDGSDPPPASASPEAQAEVASIIIAVETDPEVQAGSFSFTGVPRGTVGIGVPLTVIDLAPGTYSTTQVDPSPDYDVSAIVCDDDDSTGDPATRTAVINVAAGETVTCRFTNTRRGSVVVLNNVEPVGVGGQVSYTGVPSGTVTADSSLVVANLLPGSYTTTQVDPTPVFDLVSISCDDGQSANPSAIDFTSRSVVFRVDPGEMVTCVFVNIRRGSIAVAVETDPPESDGLFQFTGVPSGTLSSGGTLVVADLPSGTYSTTAAEPGPDFELTAIDCNDIDGISPFNGDTATRSTIYDLESGELITCTYLFTWQDEDGSNPGGTTGGGPDDGGDGVDEGEGGSPPSGGINPFIDPDVDFERFPLPNPIPPDAGTYLKPREGNWTVYNPAGEMDCGVTTLALPAGPPDTDFIDVAADGLSLVGSGVADAGLVEITLFVDPVINGRFVGSLELVQDGTPVTINYFWQVVTPEYVVAFLTSAVTAEGISCSLYRPFYMEFVGD